MLAILSTPALACAASIHHSFPNTIAGATNIMVLKCATAAGPCDLGLLATLPGNAIAWDEPSPTEGTHNYKLKAVAAGFTQTIESAIYGVNYVVPVMTGGFTGTPTATIVP